MKYRWQIQAYSGKKYDEVLKSCCANFQVLPPMTKPNGDLVKVKLYSYRRRRALRSPGD